MSTTQEVLQMKSSAFIDQSVPQVGEGDDLTSLASTISKHPDHTAFVVDSNRLLKGVVSDHDVVNALANPNFASRKAGDLMTPLDPAKATSVARDTDPLIRAIPALQKFKSIPVVDSSGTVVGQLTRASIEKNLDRLLS